MSKFIIDISMPAMGATVSELTIIDLAVAPGTQVDKGQKLAELESDKSAFAFESPADGTIVEVHAQKGEVKSSGQLLFRMETADTNLKHLEAAVAKPAPSAAPIRAGVSAAATKPLVWTPRALKLAQEGGLDHATIFDIKATGPGGRVSGDDVVKYLAGRNN